MRQAASLPCVAFLLGLTMVGGAGRAQPDGQSGKVRTEMKGIDFRIDPEVVLEIRWLRGSLIPTKEGQAPWFDDPGSFVLEIDAGEIAVSPASMGALLNHYVFTGPDAPVKDVEIEIAGNHLRQAATLRKKIPVRATIEGEVSATPEGDIRLHPVSIKAGKVPVKGLLDLFGVELSEVMKTDDRRGVRAEGDDLFLDPEKLLPPPRIKGKVTAVRLEKGRIVQVFGGGAKGEPLKPAVKAAHYMFFHGNELRFGKLTMHDADLQIVDKNPRDPFNFFLSHFSEQLVAGYSRTMPDKGLVAYMPDYDKIRK
jgi:hypothetical protein